MSNSPERSSVSCSALFGGLFTQRCKEGAGTVNHLIQVLSQHIFPGFRVLTAFVLFSSETVGLFAQDDHAGAIRNVVSNQPAFKSDFGSDGSVVLLKVNGAKQQTAELVQGAAKTDEPLSTLPFEIGGISAIGEAVGKITPDQSADNSAEKNLCYFNRSAVHIVLFVLFIPVYLLFLKWAFDFGWRLSGMASRTKWLGWMYGYAERLLAPNVV